MHYGDMYLYVCLPGIFQPETTETTGVKFVGYNLTKSWFLLP